MRRPTGFPARTQTAAPERDATEPPVVASAGADEVVVEYRPELPAIRVSVRPRTEPGEGKRGPA